MKELGMHIHNNNILITFKDTRFHWMLTETQLEVKFDKINESYNLSLPLNIFVNSFSFNLHEKDGILLIFDYSSETKILKLSSPLNKEVPTQKYNTCKIFDYEISHISIVALSIHHFLKLLEKFSDFDIYTCYLLKCGEKENLKYCLSLVKKYTHFFEELNEVEQKLNEIITSFPIIFDYQVKKILKILKNCNQYQYSDINMCIIILEELEKEDVLFFDSHIPEQETKLFEKKVDHYLCDYNKNNYAFFSRLNESNVAEIKQLQKYTLQRIPPQLKRVRRYLEVIKNTQKPSVKLEIETKISVIKQIEINILTQDTDKKISNLVDDLLNLLDSVKLFFPLELQSVLTPLFNIAKGVKSLYNIMEQFSRKKQQNHVNEELIEEMRQMRYKQQEVLSKVDSKCSKARYVILFLKNNRGGYGFTYNYIANKLTIQVSNEWIREIIGRLDGNVLEIINPHSRPHKISIYDLSEREFWDTVDRCF